MIPELQGGCAVTGPPEIRFRRSSATLVCPRGPGAELSFRCLRFRVRTPWNRRTIRGRRRRVAGRLRRVRRRIDPHRYRSTAPSLVSGRERSTPLKCSGTRSRSDSTRAESDGVRISYENASSVSLTVATTPVTSSYWSWTSSAYHALGLCGGSGDGTIAVSTRISRPVPFVFCYKLAGDVDPIGVGYVAGSKHGSDDESELSRRWIPYGSV